MSNRHIVLFNTTPTVLVYSLCFMSRSRCSVHAVSMSLYSELGPYGSHKVCVCAVVATCSDGVSDITGILAEWQ